MPSFREDKATEAAALLLRLRGGKMAYLKLIKLLYLADREALIRWKCPVTFDSFYSMDHGPVLSHTYNLIKEGEDTAGGEYWAACISPPSELREVCLVCDCPPRHLSRAEIDLLEQIFELHGHKSRWQLRDETHQLPEWKDPQGSRLPIYIREILTGAGETEANVRLAIEDLASESSLEEALS